jgi:hypothetical protein
LRLCKSVDRRTRPADHQSMRICICILALAAAAACAPIASAPSVPSATLAAIATASPLPAATSSAANACGEFEAYQAPSGARNAILAMRTQTGATNFELVGAGVIPAKLGGDPSSPEILRLTGRRVEGTNYLATAVADYNVVRVASCAP